MNERKIFIASSTEEFKEERIGLYAHLSRLSSEYAEKRGIKLVPILCENLSKSMEIDGKQETFNEEVRNSDYFYLIIGNHLGKYSRKEFDVAWEAFKRTGKHPLIYTYFYKSENKKPDENVNAFSEYIIEELKHYPSEFIHFDSIKLEITNEVMKMLELIEDVRFKDGELTLGSKEIMSLENVPMYKNNEKLQSMRKRLQDLHEEYASKRAEQYENPEDEELAEKISYLNQKRISLLEKIRDMEEALLEGWSRATGAVDIHPREEKAVRLMVQGNFNEANALLRDEFWMKQEIEPAARNLERLKNQVRKYISGKRTLVSSLKATGVSEKTIREIYAIYEEMKELILQWHIEQDALYDYSVFLHKQRDFKRGISVSEKLIHLCGIAEEASEELICKTYHLRGKLFRDDKEFLLAEAELLKAIQIYNSIKGNQSDHMANVYARICNDISEVYWSLNRSADQLKYLEMARMIFEKEVDKSDGLTSSIKSGLAENYRRTASGYRKINDFRNAIDFHQKSLNLFDELCEEDFDTYALDDSMTRNDFAYALNELNRHTESEEMYRGAVEIRRKLARMNKAAYESNLAVTLSNLSVVLRIEGKYEESKEIAYESVCIREKLVQKNPAIYCSGLAHACRNYGNCLVKTNKYDEAEIYLRKALCIRRDQIKDGLDVHGFDLLNILRDYGILLFQTGRISIAENILREALDVEQKLCTSSIRIENDLFLQTEVALAYVLGKNGNGSEAMSILEHAWKVYEPLYRQDEYSEEYYAPSIAILLNEIGCLLMSGEWNRRLEDAMKNFSQALDIYEKLVDREPLVYKKDLLYTLNNLNIVSELQGKDRNEYRERLKFLAGDESFDYKSYIPDFTF